MNNNNPSTSSGSEKKNVGQNTQFNSKAYTSSSKSEVGFQEKIMVQIRELGDSLERAGEKVERSGWEKIGQAISKLGNSLEHLREKDGNRAEMSTQTGAIASGSLSSEKYGAPSSAYGETQASPGLNKNSTTKVGGDDSQAV